MVDTAPVGFVLEEAAGEAAHPPVASELPPLTVRQMSVFSTGDAVSGMADTALGTFLLLYLTAVCGLSGTLAGLATLLSLMIDAVVDPLIGYISDSTHSRLGRRHPFMLASLAPFGVSFWLLFSAPRIHSQELLFAYCAATLIVLRISYSAFILPFVAQYAEISRDYRERSLLGAYRSFLNIIANVVCLVLAYSVFMPGQAGLVSRAGYSGFGAACALIIVAVGLFCSLGTLSMRYRMHAVGVHDRVSLPRFVAEVADVARNRSFRVLFITVLVFWVAQGLAGALGLHLSRYFWRLPTEIIELGGICLSVGLFTGIFLSAWLLRRFEKKEVSVVGLGVFCALQLVPVVLRLAGVFTAEGWPLYIVLCAIAVVTGWVSTAVGIAFGAMMADTSDEHEYLYGSRREALYFSGLTFSFKAAVGLGIFASGIALDRVINFPRDVAALGPHPVFADGVLRNLGLIAGPGAAVVSAISAIILLGYRLNEKEHARMLTAIAERKAAASG
jgi:GPH family glycoside/pentoside/hexuronide:cation symporter